MAELRKQGKVYCVFGSPLQGMGFQAITSVLLKQFDAIGNIAENHYIL